jgi:hypothetical protein
LSKPKGEAKSAETVESLSDKILNALAKSHCFFADLLDLFPSVDYKTVASTVARLYEDGKIGQDKDGRFQLRLQ